MISSLLRSSRPLLLVRNSTIRLYSSATTSTASPIKQSQPQLQQQAQQAQQVQTPISNINALPTDQFSTLKLSSNGSRNLYAIFRIHNLPYLVTKGDKVYLPYKLKGVSTGDVLDLNDVTTLGTPNYTYHIPQGIDKSLFHLKASVLEITREPLYQVVRKRQRCRRKKTYQVEPFQTVLTINELSLR